MAAAKIVREEDDETASEGEPATGMEGGETDGESVGRDGRAGGDEASPQAHRPDDQADQDDG
jgi:hypothetical protein